MKNKTEKEIDSALKAKVKVSIPIFREKRKPFSWIKFLWKFYRGQY